MNTATYEKFCEVIHTEGGIDLGPERRSLLCGRINHRMRDLNCSSYEDYLRRVTDGSPFEEIVQLLDAIATHHTFFFREPEHLFAIRDLMAARIKSGQRRFRFWSAACSSGEEVWSLAMLLIELIDDLGCREIDLRILATDISTKILKSAESATYSHERVQSIPPVLRQRFFKATGFGPQTTYTVTDRLRELVLFRRLNLSSTPYPMRGPFDAILCRNVMIYFSDEARARLIHESAKLLSDGSLFCVGLTESALGMHSDLGFCGPSTYRKSTATPVELLNREAQS